MNRLSVRYLFVCVGVSLVLTLPGEAQDYHVYFQTGGGNLFGLNNHQGTWVSDVLIGNGDPGTPLVGLTLGETQAHVYHLLNGHIYDSSCCWSQTDLTVKAGAPAPAPGTPLAAASVGGGHAIYYTTSDCHIHFISDSPAEGVSWHDRDLTVATNGTNPCPGSTDFSAVATTSATYLFFIFEGDVFTIFNNGSGNFLQDISTQVNERSAIGRPINSLVQPSNSSVHVSYEGDFGGIKGIKEAAGSSAGWVSTNLPDISNGFADIIISFLDSGGKNVFYDVPDAVGCNGGCIQPLFHSFFAFSSNSWSNVQVSLSGPFFSQGDSVLSMTGTGGFSSSKIPQQVVFIAVGLNGCNLFSFSGGQTLNINFPDGSSNGFPLPACPSDGQPFISQITSFLF